MPGETRVYSRLQQHLVDLVKDGNIQFPEQKILVRLVDIENVPVQMENQSIRGSAWRTHPHALHGLNANQMDVIMVTVLIVQLKRAMKIFVHVVAESGLPVRVKKG